MGLVTDYVFDGTSPPYTPSSQPNPLQLYGETKLDGELAVLGVDGAKVIVLRVPVLCVGHQTFAAWSHLWSFLADTDPHPKTLIRL